MIISTTETAENVVLFSFTIIIYYSVFVRAYISVYLYFNDYTDRTWTFRFILNFVFFLDICALNTISKYPSDDENTFRDLL